MNTKLLTPLVLALVVLAFPLTIQHEQPEQEAIIKFTPIQPVSPPPEIEVLTVKALPAPVQIDNVLKKIAWCESQNRQFNEDGSVLRGVVNPLDTGKFQINEKYHLANSIRLGFDIHTLEGNEGYAQHLFETQGSTPWNWSRPCWGDPNRVWTERGGELWSK